MEQTKEIIKSSVNDNSICNLCAFQAYCGLCPVYNYSKNSSIIPIISRDDRCHILKSQFEFILDKLLNDKSFYEKFKKISTDLINPSTFIYNPSIISK